MMAKTLEQLNDYINTEPEIRSLINETVKYLKAAWPPDGSSVQTVYQRKTILTDDQIKALPTSSVELVPSPGVGKVLMVTGFFIQFKFTSGYTLSSPTDSVGTIGWDNGSGGTQYDACYYINASAFTTSDPNYCAFGGSYGGIGANIYDAIISGFSDTNLSNRAMVLSSYNSGNLTGGDPSNTLEVTVFYSIVDL